jgi:hypothetical protein
VIGGRLHFLRSIILIRMFRKRIGGSRLIFGAGTVKKVVGRGIEGKT